MSEVLAESFDFVCYLCKTVFIIGLTGSATAIIVCLGITGANYILGGKGWKVKND